MGSTSDSAREQVRSFATDTLADYLSDDPERLFELLTDSDQTQFSFTLASLTAHQERAIELGSAAIALTPAADASEDDKEELALRQANTAVMLLRMDATDQVWPLLRHSPDPRLRSYIIHWLRPLGADPAAIIGHYDQETDVTVQRALLLCLGEFDATQVSESDRAPFTESLLKVYSDHPDPGLHAAAEWLLRRWGQGEQIAALGSELQQSEEQPQSGMDYERRWNVNGQGQTLVIFDADEFQMGSPESEPRRVPGEVLHQRRIGRRLAICTAEVTKAQWRKFSQSQPGVLPADAPSLAKLVRTDDSVMVSISWYEAARYCNWLSEQEGIPDDNWCYEPNADCAYAPDMKARDNFLELSGYRLPTEPEWEFACRAGAVTSRYYGHSEALLPQYAWYLANADDHTWPVASLKPNDFGLFDMQGNVYEWCFDPFRGYAVDSPEAVKDAPGIANVTDDLFRVLLGGAFNVSTRDARSACRGHNYPDYRNYVYGFRVARTYR